MSNEELIDLAEDIAANGQQEPIWLYDGKILDGRNRYRACFAKNVEPRTEHYTGRDPLRFVLSKNLHRRHLTVGQRAMVAADLATMRSGERTDLDFPSELPKVSQAEAAELVGVSPRSVVDAVKVKVEGVPELVKAVADGTIPVSAAANIADLPAPQQRTVVAGGPAKVKETARIHREERKAEPEPVAAPDGEYEAPAFASYKPKGGGRSTEEDDPPGPFDEILARMTALSRMFTDAMNGPDGELLKKYLSYLTATPLKAHYVWHQDTFKDGKKLPSAVFHGFRGLRAIVRMANTTSKRGKVRNDKEIQAAYREAVNPHE